MNRFAIQTLLRRLVVRRLVRLLLYVLLILYLSSATLVVLERQALSRGVALVPCSQMVCVNVAPIIRGEASL